jgi:dolichol-phosphate mannosyltransferase
VSPHAAPQLSVVVPIFNEERTLAELHRRLTAVLAAETSGYEIVFVNDGSRDGSLAAMRALGATDPRIKVVSLSRNFGHQTSITAGLDHAGGEAIVIMDGDLQDPPEVIPALLAEWRKGFDVVYAVRRERAGESRFKRWTATVFYRLFARVTKLDVPLDAGDFRLLSRRAADHVRSIRETNRYVRGLTSWIGLKQVGVSYTRDERWAGDTKFGLAKMLRFGLDGITSFSFLPLQVSTAIGVVIALVCVVVIVWAVWARMVSHDTVPGWASTIVIILFLSAIQFLILGVYGEYIGRIYAEVKRRPLYIVDETLNVTAPTPGEPPERPARADA